MLLSVRTDVCLENYLNTYTCFQPFGLMPGLLSEHPAEGVYFQSHIRITLQINKDILELVSLLRQVAARCAGCSVGHRLKGVTLHPNGRVRRR